MAEEAEALLPIARLIDCSNKSRFDWSSFDAASLNAAGEDVAYDNNCATVCDVAGSVVDG